MNINEFFEKLCFEKRENIIMFFGKEIKRKLTIKMNYNEAEIDIPPKITLQPEFFL